MGSNLGTALLAFFVLAIPLRLVRNLAVKDRRRTHRAETVALVLLLVLIVGWAWETRRELASLAPPAGVKGFIVFAAQMPPPHALERMRSANRDYLVWTGRRAGPCALVYGPAYYLFDRHGDLVDWQPASGDGGPVEDVIQDSTEIVPISLPDALTLIRTGIK